MRAGESTAHGPDGGLVEEIHERHARSREAGDAEILGVSTGADTVTVRAAFLDLARRFHPDHLAGLDASTRDQAEALFARMTEAYRRLATGAPRARPAGASTASARRSASITPEIASPRPAEPSRRERVDEALSEAVSLAGRDPEAAIALLHGVLGLADERQRPRLRVLLARAYTEVPRLRRNGVRLLQEMTDERPTDADALATLGALYRREGLLARADSTLRRALRADPGHAVARAELREVRSALQSRRPKPPLRPRRGLVSRLFSRKTQEETC